MTGARSQTPTVPVGAGSVSVCGSAVCQRIFPVAGSSAIHEPPVTVRAREDAVLGQVVGDVVLVRERAVDALPVIGGAPLEAALVAAGADERVPDELCPSSASNR